MLFQQDTVIFERLQDKQMYMDSTVEQLEDFAKEGKWTTSTMFVKSFVDFYQLVKSSGALRTFSGQLT